MNEDPNQDSAGGEACGGEGILLLLPEAILEKTPVCFPSLPPLLICPSPGPQFPFQP